MMNAKSGNFDSVFKSMRDRMGGVNGELKRLKELSAKNETALLELVANVRQHKDRSLSQVECYSNTYSIIYRVGNI